MQAPLLDGFAFDPFALFDDGFCPSEVGISGCDVAQARRLQGSCRSFLRLLEGYS